MPNSSRIISYEQLVIEADPDYIADDNQPIIYEIRNGREFFRQLPCYSPPWFTLDDSNQGHLDQNQLG